MPAVRPSTLTPDLRAILDRAAQLAGVDARILYALAEVESGFNPLAEGDRDWPNRSDHYKRFVLENKSLSTNPARNDPSAWHSYGLFQLLAPYHVTAKQHPKELLDPKLNAAKAALFVRRILGQTNGDLWAMRKRYIGAAAIDDTRLAPQKERWFAALARHGLRMEA